MPPNCTLINIVLFIRNDVALESSVENVVPFIFLGPSNLT